MRKADEVIGPFDPLVGGVPEDEDAFFLIRRLAPERAQRVAEAFSDPIARSVGLAIVEIERNKPFGARRRLEEVLEEAPGHVEARAALLRLQAGRIAQGADPTTVVAAPLSDAERTLCDGWLARAGDPTGAALLALDDRLAAIPARHPLAVEAARLRIQARLRAGDAQQIEEAIVLAEDGLGDRPEPASLLLRAEVAAAGGDTGLALEVLNELIPRLEVARGSDEALWRRAREIAKALPVERDMARFHARVLRLLRVWPDRRAQAGPGPVAAG
jgi:hypothetical protein